MNETPDVGDVKQVKQRKTKAQLAQERKDEELREILSTEGGRYFVWRLMSECHMYGSVSHQDPMRMAQLSGMRDVGLAIMEELMTSHPSIYPTMVLEAKEREE
jgi:hypothetical protein